MIPLSVPNLRGNEIKYLKECIKTEFVSSVGNYVNLFEKKICKYTKSKYAVACTSGTAALHLALRILNVKENDEVIVPTMTFVATVNAVRYLNAKPIFLPKSYNEVKFSSLIPLKTPAALQLLAINDAVLQ